MVYNIAPSYFIKKTFKMSSTMELFHIYEFKTVLFKNKKLLKWIKNVIIHHNGSYVSKIGNYELEINLLKSS